MSRKWIYLSESGRAHVAAWRKGMAMRWNGEDNATLMHNLYMFTSPKWSTELYEPEMQARVIRNILNRRFTVVFMNNSGKRCMVNTHDLGAPLSFTDNGDVFIYYAAGDCDVFPAFVNL